MRYRFIVGGRRIRCRSAALVAAHLLFRRVDLSGVRQPSTSTDGAGAAAAAAAAATAAAAAAEAPPRSAPPLALPAPSRYAPEPRGHLRRPKLGASTADRWPVETTRWICTSSNS